MRQLFLVLLAIAIMLPVYAMAADEPVPNQRAQSEYNFGHMTPEQIQELKEQRHAFYKAEKGDKQDQIRAMLLAEATKTNLNQMDYDVRYYGIHLSLNFTNASIDGYIDYKIKAVSSGFNEVDLDFDVNMSVTSVTVDGSPASYNQYSPDDLVIVTPTTYSAGQEFDMRVYYNGFPSYANQQGMAFGYLNGYQCCWTNCEPWGSRYWWPCKDDTGDKPDSIDLYIEYPNTDKLVSNGALISDTDIGGGRKLAHWKHNYPIATYLTAITCGPFQSAVDTWNYNSTSMPIYSYGLPGTGSLNSYRFYMPDVLTNLSDAFGLYPFSTEKAGCANYGWGGAMEHQTCSFFNPTFYDEYVIAHETTHQWWGDMITCRSFNHVWLNEGGASYGEAIYFEAEYGEAAYFDWMQSQKYLGPGTIYVEDPLTQDIFDGSLSYDKASWVWHMLRGVIGDAAFFQFMQDWHYSQFQYGAATTQDFITVLSNSVGEDMSWYVNEWIYGDGHPEYQLSWKCTPNESKATGYDFQYYVEQVQSSGSFFTMPMRTIFHTTGADIDTTLWYGPTSYYEFNFADSVTGVVLDPQEWVLREYSYAPFTFHLATVTLPDAELGVEYADTLKVVGGVPPYTWVKLSGDLPYGMTFDYTNGILHGVPSWEGNYYFTMRVSDSNDPQGIDQRAYSVHVGPQQPTQPLGDCNGDDLVNVTDAVYLIQWIFAGGPAPDPLTIGDVNCDGFTNITDAVFIIQYIFAGGPEPNCD